MTDTTPKPLPKPHFIARGEGYYVSEINEIRSALEWITEMEEQRLRLLKSENRNQFQEGYFAAMMVCKKLRSKSFAAVMK